MVNKIKERFCNLAMWLVLVSVMLIGSCSDNQATKQDAKEVLLQGRTMGTSYNVKLITHSADLDIKLLHHDIELLLEGINQVMSTYIIDSELSLLNQNQQTTEITMSVGLAQVLNEAIRLGELSQGKLDVTVGPLVNLWGFGPDYRPENIPSSQALARAKARTGLDKLVLTGQQLTKSVADVYIDLSTIAKGYGVDQVAKLLEAQGLVNYLVEIGGEMRLKGFKHTGELWHVAIEKPNIEERAVHQIIVPGDNAVATSGDYRNYYEVDGQRFSHIIDPSTGLPIAHKLVSVTVIAPSAMTADGLSTALMVMGEEQALAFATQHDIAAYIISKTEDGFKEQITVKFMPYLK